MRQFDARIALGLPSLAGYELFEALALTRALGFQSVMTLPGGPNAVHSLGSFPTLGWERTTEAQREAIRMALRPFAHLSLHQAWDDDWRAWVDCAREIGAEILTVHAGLRHSDQSSAAFVDDRAAYFRELGAYAADNGVRIGVENEGGALADYLHLVEALDFPTVGATLDVGHCGYFRAVQTQPTPGARADALNAVLQRLVSDLGDRLIHMHVHNVRQGDWRDHRAVPEGVIDFEALFTALEVTGYRGLFDIELEEPDRVNGAAASGAFLTTLCAWHLRSDSA